MEKRIGRDSLHEPLRYKDFSPASRKATAAARSSSKKSGTKPELMLRQALWRAGCRYRKNVKGLPGNPDLVFISKRIVVFCDGDFWHGKGWEQRKAKLEKGHNPAYWIAKIARNMERDQDNNRRLEEAGWHVIRVWESDIKGNLKGVVDRILVAMDNGGYT